MKKIILFTLMCLTITFSYGDSKIGINKLEERTLIKLNTNKGNIIIKLFSEDAPETSKNFITYVEGENYNGTIFHRVINNFMIQGGGHLPDMSEISTNPLNETSPNTFIVVAVIVPETSKFLWKETSPFTYKFSEISI